MRERNILNALIHELEENSSLMEKAVNTFSKGIETIKSYPFYIIVAYTEAVRAGLLFKIPENIRNALINLYQHIQAQNSLSTARRFGLTAIGRKHYGTYSSLLKELSLRAKTIAKELKNLQKTARF